VTRGRHPRVLKPLPGRRPNTPVAPRGPCLCRKTNVVELAFYEVRRLPFLCTSAGVGTSAEGASRTPGAGTSVPRRRRKLASITAAGGVVAPAAKRSGRRRGATRAPARRAALPQRVRSNALRACLPSASDRRSCLGTFCLRPGQSFPRPSPYDDWQHLHPSSVDYLRAQPIRERVDLYLFGGRRAHCL
jgi:hypothetical protein